MNITETTLNDKLIEKTLRRLGLNRSYKGFNYLICAINLVLVDSNSLNYICKGLYIEVALQYNTTVANVERNIRTAKKVIWFRCNKNILKDVFGDRYSLYMPNNANFIDMLADYIKSLLSP